MISLEAQKHTVRIDSDAVWQNASVTLMTAAPAEDSVENPPEFFTEHRRCSTFVENDTC
jgi:hypothetical protein